MAKTIEKKYFVGVDVGGTKVLATLVSAGGRVIGRHRIATPTQKKPAVVVDTILDTVHDVVAAAGMTMPDVAGVGMAIPGVVDSDAGRIINTANMNLGGMEMVSLASAKLRTPIFLGNDANLGALGEKWLGTAMDADSVVGIFVGTGIGGGVVVGGRLITGPGEGAGEIGHMIMSLGGPKCGCGMCGCFEALAGRAAIDRDIRAAVADGRKSVISNLVDLSKPDERIRSGALRKALNKGDALVTEIISRAAEIIGLACLSIRRVVDPDVLLFGGGVIEACGSFILPIVEEVIASDPLASPKPSCRVLESALGDDAVALGAVALAQQKLGMDPFARPRLVRYPKLTLTDEGFRVSGKTRRRMLLRADGTVLTAEEFDGKLVSDLGKGRLGDRSIRQLCLGRPHAVFVGLSSPGPLKLSKRAENSLHFHDLRLEMLPLSQAVDAFQAFKGRKAFLLVGDDENDNSQKPQPAKGSKDGD